MTETLKIYGALVIGLAYGAMCILCTIGYIGLILFGISYIVHLI